MVPCMPVSDTSMLAFGRQFLLLFPASLFHDIWFNHAEVHRNGGMLPRHRNMNLLALAVRSSMIRLSAESTAFYQGNDLVIVSATRWRLPITQYPHLSPGSGWRSYESYIGAPILYPSYSTEIRQALMTSPRVQSVIRRLAREALVKKGGDRRPPDAPSTAAGDRTRMCMQYARCGCRWTTC